MKGRLVLTERDAGFVVERIFGPNHRGRSECGDCGQDVSRVALVSLAYTFESCGCGDPEYVHLVEQPYHRDCLRQQSIADLLDATDALPEDAGGDPLIARGYAAGWTERREAIMQKRFYGVSS